MKELLEIQKELKVGKTLYNKFGGFYYRSAETILEAVKPILKRHECILTLTDEAVCIGNRNYVKATAVLSALDERTNPESITVSAYAREAESKKGMDSAQLTGACSSYARKYALQGLFLLDESGADIDSKNNTIQEPPEETRINIDGLEADRENQENHMNQMRSEAIADSVTVEMAQTLVQMWDRQLPPDYKAPALATKGLRLNWAERILVAQKRLKVEDSVKSFKDLTKYQYDSLLDRLTKNPKSVAEFLTLIKKEV